MDQNNNYVLDGDTVTMSCSLEGYLQPSQVITVTPPGGGETCAQMTRESDLSHSNCTLRDGCAASAYSASCLDNSTLQVIIHNTAVVDIGTWSCGLQGSETSVTLDLEEFGTNQIPDYRYIVIIFS